MRWVREHLDDPLYRSGYFLMLNTVVLTGSGFLFWLLAARFADPEAVGLATSIVGAITMVTVVSKLGFDVSLLQFLPKANPPATRALVSTAFTVSCTASLGLGALAAVAASIWSNELASLGASLWAVLSFAILTMIWTSGILADSVFTGRRASDIVLWKNLAHALLRVAALALALGLIRNVTADHIVYSSIATVLLPTVVVFLLWARREDPALIPRPRVDRDMLARLYAGAFANSAAALVMIVPRALGTLIVIDRFGAAEAAFFYLLWMFGSVGLIAPTAFSKSSLVEIAHTGNASILLQGRALAISVVAGAGILVAGLILPPLLGSAYADLGVLALLPFVLAAVPGFFLHARMTQFRATEQHAALVISALAAASIFLVGLAVLPLPLKAIGWTWLIALGIAGMLSFTIPLRPLDVVSIGAAAEGT